MNYNKPTSFMRTISNLAISFQFELYSEYNAEDLRKKIIDAIKTNWPKVTSYDEVTINFKKVNYTPKIEIGAAIIQEMELYYPEVML